MKILRDIPDEKSECSDFYDNDKETRIDCQSPQTRPIISEIDFESNSWSENEDDMHVPLSELVDKRNPDKWILWIFGVISVDEFSRPKMAKLDFFLFLFTKDIMKDITNPNIYWHTSQYKSIRD